VIAATLDGSDLTTKIDEMYSMKLGFLLHYHYLIQLCVIARCKANATRTTWTFLLWRFDWKTRRCRSLISSMPISVDQCPRLGCGTL
jgi:hypothetical protein